MPSTRPTPMRAPAPAARSEPNTNGSASSTANPAATVRAIREWNANTGSRASRPFDSRWRIIRQSEADGSWPGAVAAMPRKAAPTLLSKVRPGARVAIARSPSKRVSAYCSSRHEPLLPSPSSRAVAARPKACKRLSGPIS